MKLERSGSLVVLMMGLAGCASKPPAAPAPAPVATTRVNAATMTIDEAPRVGKPQRSAAPTDAAGAPGEPLDAEKEPRRDDGRRGGFSGWK